MLDKQIGINFMSFFFGERAFTLRINEDIGTFDRGIRCCKCQDLFSSRLVSDKESEVASELYIQHWPTFVLFGQIERGMGFGKAFSVR